MPRKKKLPGEDYNCLSWTPMMDDALIDAFLDQHNLGNRVNGNFTAKAYGNIVKELKEKIGNHTGKDIGKDKVQNRWKTIKANFSKCFDMFSGTSGFAWSPITKMWNAKPEVWQKLIEAKPEAAEWMSKPIPHYDKLLILYEDGRASGKRDKRASENKKRQQSKIENDFVDTFGVVDHFVPQNEVLLETFDSCADDNLEEIKLIEVHSGNLEHNSKAKKAKKSRDSNEFEQIKEALCNVAEALREGNAVSEKAFQRLPIQEEEVWKLLEELDIGQQLVAQAYLHLIEKPENVRAILGCPKERRKNILLLMMFGPSHSSSI